MVARSRRALLLAAPSMVSEAIAIFYRKQNVEAKERDAKRKPAGSKKADLMVRRSNSGPVLAFSHGRGSHGAR